MAKKQLCISVEGGGALGIGPLAFMCRLEQDLGKKLCDYAVAFTGTSTGSIIAGGLDEGLSAHEIFDLYKNNLKRFLLSILGIRDLHLLVRLMITVI